MNRPVTKHLLGSFSGIARQRGEGLIEVLVAVLVLAIGMLGIALMQTRALSGNNSTMSRSTAVVASYSILEAMRADRANAVAGSYNKTMSGDTCTVTTTALAQNQLIRWCTVLAGALGATSLTTGVISCASSGICDVTITFDDSRIGKGGSTSTVPLSVKTRAAL